MEEFVNFITQYWKIIALAVVVLLEIVLLIFKGKTKTVYFNRVADLTNLISQAENKFDDPAAKLLYVVEQYYKNNPDSEIPLWMLKQSIEQILSTPTKKGGLGREQDN